MKNYPKYLLVLSMALLSLVGCKDGDGPLFSEPTPDVETSINWKAEVQNLANAYTDKRVDAVQRSVDELRNEVRGIPSKPSFGIQTVSYSKPNQDLGLIDDGGVEIIDGTDEIKALTSAVNSLPKPVDHSADIKALTDAVSALTRKSQSAPIAATYSAAPQAPTYASAPPVSYQSAPTTYASGPKTYGSTRPGGYKTVRKTRRVARTVYDEVPYEEQVAVAVRDVYQTVQEQVPVSVTKTRMRTEQRTRKVAKTVYVDEPYSVQVPEQYSETVMQTRSRRVKVDTEQVEVAAAPVAVAASPVRCEPAVSFSAAPTPAPVVYSAPPSYAAEPCVECTPAPSYSVAPTTFSAAPVLSSQYSAPRTAAPVAPPAFFSVAKPRNYVEMPAASPVQFSAPQVFSSPQVFAAPQTFDSTPQVFAAPAQETQLMASVPVATVSPRLRPFATATNAYSQVRKQNQTQRGGGLFQRGKPPTCVNGKCALP